MEKSTKNNAWYSDKERFYDACLAICGSGRSRAGIGTLSEKTLHAAVKRFIEPDAMLHEVQLGRSVADVRNADGIYEIQTRSFNRLRPKLGTFLEMGEVTVVYPIPATKRLIWMDTQTGEMTTPRKSPKRGSCYDAFFELYKLDTLIAHRSLSILLLFIDMDEYRYLNGWSADGKKGSTRCERIPTALSQSVLLTTNADYLSLLPENLPETFTSKALASAAKIHLRTAQQMLMVLVKRGALRCTGKDGRLNLYKRNNEE